METVDLGCAESVKSALPAVNFMDPRLPDRFWDLTSPCPMSGCWLWIGHHNPNGTPIFHLERSEARAVGKSRPVSARCYVVNTLLGGAKASGKLSASCGSQSCCNPAHARTRLTGNALATSLRNCARAHRQRNRHGIESKRILKRYGLDGAALQRLLDDQVNSCPICLLGFKHTDGHRPAGRDWHIDHRHPNTKDIRGLLCTRCNMGIGLLRDRPSTLRAGADYLERHINRARQ